MKAKNTNIYTAKSKSNLGFTEDVTVTMQLVHDEKNDYAKLEFSTGFKTRCDYVRSKKDHTGNKILTYSYKGYNDEKHYLHVRIVKGKLYCQTVQTGESAGGSTWEIKF